MNTYRVRVQEIVSVVTSVAVCYAPAQGVFVLRYAVRWRDEGGVPVCETYRAPLSRRELIDTFSGPELADWLMAHPGHWWRMPMAERREEGSAA
jgi:hypothetical protein